MGLLVERHMRHGIDIEPGPSFTDFQELVRTEVLLRGDENHPRYDRYLPAAEPRNFDYFWDSQTGNVTFGENWFTHRLDIGNRQLIYAYKPPVTDATCRSTALRAGRGVLEMDSAVVLLPEAEFFIHEFDDDRMVARTRFTEHPQGLIKSRVTIFDAYNGAGLIEMARHVRRKERPTLEAVISNPEANEIAIGGLTRLTFLDRLHIAVAHGDYEDEQRKLQEDLASMAQQPLLPRSRS